MFKSPGGSPTFALSKVFSVSINGKYEVAVHQVKNSALPLNSSLYSYPSSKSPGSPVFLPSNT